jgi:hypothetical protein
MKKINKNKKTPDIYKVKRLICVVRKGKYVQFWEAPKNKREAFIEAAKEAKKNNPECEIFFTDGSVDEIKEGFKKMVANLIPFLEL